MPGCGEATMASSVTSLAGCAASACVLLARLPSKAIVKAVNATGNAASFREATIPVSIYRSPRQFIKGMTTKPYDNHTLSTLGEMCVATLGHLLLETSNARRLT